MVSIVPAIEHSENRIITIFENEFGPGVLQTSVQKNSSCKNSKQQGQNGTTVNDISFASLAFLQQACLLNTELEYFRSNLVFRQLRLCSDLIFRNALEEV